ncbi:WD40 repeat-like protein, partial [Caulochytrium protostelioides]
MNIGSRSTNDLLFMTFNQDYSCLAIGTRQGYRIYNCDPFGKCYGRSDGGIGIIEMLFCTSLVALVGAGSQAAFSPRRLQVSNTKRQSTICELTYPSAVLAVRLNRRRLVVMLETNIYLYDVSNMRVLHTLDTAPNPRAVCALSPSPDSCFLAYPTHGGAGSAAGEILLFDAIDLQAVHIIAAHKTPVAALAFNDDGTLLASASDKGTVIRIFAVPSGEKLYQFRRGSYPATIYSMAFRRDSSLLAVSSDTDTIHIFRLNKHGSKPSDAAGGSGGSGARGFGADPGADASLDASFGSAATGLSSTPLASVGSKVGAYILPDAISEMWEPQRDFASAKLPS